MEDTVCSKEQLCCEKCACVDGNKTCTKECCCAEKRPQTAEEIRLAKLRAAAKAVPEFRFGI